MVKIWEHVFFPSLPHRAEVFQAAVTLQFERGSLHHPGAALQSREPTDGWYTPYRRVHRISSSVPCKVQFWDFVARTLGRFVWLPFGRFVAFSFGCAAPASFQPLLYILETAAALWLVSPLWILLLCILISFLTNLCFSTWLQTSALTRLAFLKPQAKFTSFLLSVLAFVYNNNYTRHSSVFRRQTWKGIALLFLNACHAREIEILYAHLWPFVLSFGCLLLLDLCLVTHLFSQAEIGARSDRLQTLTRSSIRAWISKNGSHPCVFTSTDTQSVSVLALFIWKAEIVKLTWWHLSGEAAVFDMCKC